MAGKVTATSGTIGGWTLGANLLMYTTTINDVTREYYIQGADGSNSVSVFGIHKVEDDTWLYQVKYDGTVACTNITTGNGSGHAYNVLSSEGYTVNAMYFLSTNQLVVGSASYPTRIYDSAVYSNVSITVSSDERLKQDIVALDSAHDALFDGLRPVAYRYKAAPGKLHMGLTVQDTEAAEQAAGLRPEDYALTDWQLDAETGERYGALSYEELIPLLIQQVQQLKARVKALEGG